MPSSIGAGKKWPTCLQGLGCIHRGQVNLAIEIVMTLAAFLKVKFNIHCIREGQVHWLSYCEEYTQGQTWIPSLQMWWTGHVCKW